MELRSLILVKLNSIFRIYKKHIHPKCDKKFENTKKLFNYKLQVVELIISRVNHYFLTFYFLDTYNYNNLM